MYENRSLENELMNQKSDLLSKAIKDLDLTDSELKTLKWLVGLDIDTVGNIAAVIAKSKVKKEDRYLTRLESEIEVAESILNHEKSRKQYYHETLNLMMESYTDGKIDAMESMILRLQDLKKTYELERKK